MNRSNRAEISVAVLMIGASGWLFTSFASAGAPQPADLVLLSGKILTVDPQDSVAQAVAIADGKIVAVGRNAQIETLIGAKTEVIDLEGRTATPGLIDAHAHFSASSSAQIDLGDPAIRRIDDILIRLRERIAAAQPGEWIQGGGWDEGKLIERRYVLASDLDKIAPDNPVWLTHTTGHYGVANSYALKLANITRRTAEPPGGSIDRDPQSNPTGVLKEAAMELATRAIPPLTPEQAHRDRKAAIAKMIEGFNREGMTGVKDPGIDLATWAIYQELLREGRLKVRIFALFSTDGTLESARSVIEILKSNPKPPAAFGNDQLLSGGAKLFLDGSGGARTAWMHEEWRKNSTEVDRGNYGYPTIDPDLYRQIFREFHKAGFHVGTHVIGDRAIDWVVDTYEQALKDRPTLGLRHSLIHANTPSDHANEVMARLQRDFDAAYPEPSPAFMWWIGDNYAGNLGPQRALRLEPLKTWQAKGIRWASGSDYSVTPFPARYGIWASIARRTHGGIYGETPFGIEESVDIRTALRSFTLWAAHQLFLDDRVGSIEVGKRADIAVWDRDLYSVPADRLKELKCELTLLDGRVVYRASTGPAVGRLTRQQTLEESNQQ